MQQMCMFYYNVLIKFVLSQFRVLFGEIYRLELSGWQVGLHFPISTNWYLKAIDNISMDCILSCSHCLGTCKMKY